MKTFTSIALVLAFLCFAAADGLAFSVPPLRARVNDYAGLLNAEQRAKLESTLESLERRTSSQVAILTVSSLEGEEMKSFAFKVATTWQLGQKGADNGLLIAYSTDGDHFQLEVRYRLEGAIPDGLAGDIRREQFRANAPKSGAKDYNAAFTAVVQRISQIIESEYAKDPSGASMRHKDRTALVLAIILGLIATCIFAALGYLAAGIAGGVSGGVLAYVLSGGFGLLIGLAIIGAIVGLIIRLIGEAGAGGHGGSGGWLTSSGGGGDSLFSGCGGDFGGGGAGD